MKFFSFLLFFLFSLFFLSSCANEGSSAVSPDIITGNNKYITFTMSVRGKMAPNVFYCILFNSNGDKIQPDDVATFTDVIRIQYVSELQPPLCQWFHKTNPTDNQLTPVGFLDSYLTLTPDGTTAVFTFDTTDNAVIFNNYITSIFSAQALTASINDADIGRFIDALGPDLASATLYTITADKKTGPVAALNPSTYPSDFIGDCEAANIPAEVLYESVDISSFKIELK